MYFHFASLSCFHDTLEDVRVPKIYQLCYVKMLIWKVNPVDSSFFFDIIKKTDKDTSGAVGIHVRYEYNLQLLLLK